MEAKWSGFKEGLYDVDDEFDRYWGRNGEEDGDENSTLNAFEFAILLWNHWHVPARPDRSTPEDPTLLCELLHHAGAPDKLHEGVQGAFERLFQVYFVNTRDPVWLEKGVLVQSNSVQFEHWEEDFLLVDRSAPLLDRLLMFCVRLQTRLTAGREG
ncbi:hypothetical protein PG997_015065 [Apiospora hydei]|uniref:Uncharacterized protein n=1 Tax=Apiospora hydei TaxID=1337664 RepID=A0ABR1UVM1_9PEZI